MRDMKEFFRQSWLVLLVSLICGAGVAAVYGQLEGKIRKNAEEKLLAQEKILLPDAVSFTDVRSKGHDGKPGELLYSIGKDARGNIVGYAMKAAGSGFADTIVLLVAFDRQLDKLRGIGILKSNETPGFGDKIKDKSKNGKISFKDQFKGCPTGKRLIVVKHGDRGVADRNIVAISGATISSNGVTQIVNKAIERAKKIIKVK